jgi:uncharacterized protein YecT (DUF1311 family)
MSKLRLLIGFSALIALGGCKDWLFDKQPEVANNTQVIGDNAMNAVVSNIADGSSPTAADQKCASQQTYDAIKKSLFDAARKKVTTNPLPLGSLQNASVVRMTAPLVVNDNVQLQRTDCSGQLALMLPPSASSAFGGSNMLQSSVQYAVQQAADHSGVVVQVTGADSISDQLASATDLVAQHKALGGGSDGSVTPFAGKTYNPSFDCGGKLTNAMRMICQDEDLAAQDRDLNTSYQQKKAATPKPDLPALIQTQRAFLKSRDNCPDPACMKDLYSKRSDALDNGE